MDDTLKFIVPNRRVGLIIGPRGIKSGVVELKCRATGEREELSPESALARRHSASYWRSTSQ